MQVSVEEVGSLTRKLKIVLPSDLVTQKIDAAYKKLASEVNIKGFRKGKIPRQILEKGYRPKVEYEVGEALIQESYFDALQESKLDVVVHPEIKEQNFADDGTFSYDAEVAVRPHFELDGYKGIEIEHEEITVTDDEIAGELERMRQESAPLRNITDRPVQNGDIAVIDFQGYDEGEPIKQVVGKDYSVNVGSGKNGQLFEEALLGIRPGEETSRTIPFPADFPNPVMAGRDIEFRISLRELKEPVLPELDDEFAKDMGEEFETLEDLRGHIRKTLFDAREEKISGDLTDKLMLKLLASQEIELPERLVMHEIAQFIEETEAAMQRQGKTLADAGMTRQSLITHYREAAERRVKGDFVLKKIAELEDIKLADEDIDKGFQRIADQYNMAVEEVKKYFQRREELLPFMHELLNEKILRFIRQEAKINYVPASKQDAIAPAANDAAGAAEEA